MATAAQDILIRMKLEDQTSAKLKETDKNLDALGTSGKKAGNDISRGMDKAEKSAKGLSGVFGKLKGALGLAAVGFAIGKVIKSFSALEETTSKFNKVFESTGKNMRKVVTDLTTSYAMSTQEARKYLSSVQDLLVPMGLNADLAANMSEQVVKLAADLGSFNDVPTAQVMMDIQSALVGNFETMKKYGVVLNETVIKQEAMNMGLWNGKGVLDAATKASVAFSLVQKGSAAAIGDMARTADGFANKVKVFQARFNDFLANAGEKLIPIASTMLSAFTAMLEPIGSFIDWLIPATTNVKKLEDAVKDLNTAQKSIAKNNDLLKHLNNLEVGSKAYEDTVKELIKLNPHLEGSNITVASSFKDIEGAIKGANKEIDILAQGKALDEYGKGLNTLKDLTADLTIAQKALNEKVKDSSPEYIKNEVVVKRYELKIKKLSEALKSTGERVGLSHNQVISSMRSSMSVYSDNLANVSNKINNLLQANIKTVRQLTNDFARFTSLTAQVGQKIVIPKAKKFTGSGVSRDFINLEDERNKLRLEKAEGLARKLLKIDLWLQKEQEDLNKKYESQRFDRYKATQILLDRYEQKIKDARFKDDKKKQEELRQGQLNTIAGIEQGYGALKKVIEGDVIGALSSLAQATGDPWLKAAAVAATVIKDIFSLFGSEGAKWAEEFEAQLTGIMDTFSSGQTSTKFYEDLFGEGSEEAIASGLDNARSYLNSFFNTIGTTVDREGLTKFRSGWGKGLDQFKKWLSAEGDQGWIADGLVSAFSTEELYAKIDELFGSDASLVKRLLGDPKVFEDFIDEFDGDMSKINELFKTIEGSIDEALNAYTQIAELEPKEAVVEFSKELKKVNHELNTGQITQEESNVRLLAIYDGMIEALTAIGGQEEAIWKIQEDRYALEQSITAEKEKQTEIADKYLQGLKGAQLLELEAQLKAHQTAVLTGEKRAGSLSDISTQQALLQSIIENLTSQGASAADILPYQEQLAALLKGSLGESGFRALSGTGSAVQLPTQYTQSSNSSNISNSSSTTNNFTMNGQSVSLPPDLMNWLMEVASQQTGYNLVGA